MKKGIKIIVLAVIALVLFTLIGAFVFFYVLPVIKIGISQSTADEVFLTSSQSPDGEYNLEAYRLEPGATVDFSIIVYSVENNNKTIVYNAYHEYDIQIAWIDNSSVLINGKSLDLSCGEKYDWRKN